MNQAPKAPETQRISLDKTCTRCGVVAALSEFARDATKASGRKGICRSCDNVKSRRYYDEHRERILARKAGNPKACVECGGEAISSRHQHCEGCRARAVDRKVRSRRSGRGWAGFPPTFRDCLGCGAGFIALAPHGRFCSDSCRVQHRPGTTTERGYGHDHQMVRRAWAPVVAAGCVDCARCGSRIEPGSPWDLGHDDRDRSRYAGPEHRACNRATAMRQRKVSRSW